MKAPENFVQRLNGQTFSSNGFGFLIEVIHESEIYIMPDTEIDFKCCILVKNDWDSGTFDVRICELGMGSNGMNVQNDSKILKEDILSLKDYIKELENMTAFHINEIIKK
jgi:hypothetical protein